MSEERIKAEGYSKDTTAVCFPVQRMSWYIMLPSGIIQLSRTTDKQFISFALPLAHAFLSRVPEEDWSKTRAETLAVRQHELTCYLGEQGILLDVACQRQRNIWELLVEERERSARWDGEARWYLLYLLSEVGITIPVYRTREEAERAAASQECIYANQH